MKGKQNNSDDDIMVYIAGIMVGMGIALILVLILVFFDKIGVL